MEKVDEQVDETITGERTHLWNKHAPLGQGHGDLKDLKRREIA